MCALTALGVNHESVKAAVDDCQNGEIPQNDNPSRGLFRGNPEKVWQAPRTTPPPTHHPHPPQTGTPTTVHSHQVSRKSRQLEVSSGTASCLFLGSQEKGIYLMSLHFSGCPRPVQRNLKVLPPRIPHDGHQVSRRPPLSPTLINQKQAVQTTPPEPTHQTNREQSFANN